MSILLYIVGFTWIIVGVLIVLGARNDNASGYEDVTGQVADPLELSREEHDVYPEQRVVMATIRLVGDPREYRVRGKLYHLNRPGMESIRVGETLRLMVKKTSIVGGFQIKPSATSAPVSGVYRSNGEAIIPLEKGMAHAKKRVWIGIGLAAMGLMLLRWVHLTYS